MRLILVPLCLFTAVSTRVCDSEDKGSSGSQAAAEPGAATSGSLAGQVKAALAAPRLGGSVVAAGNFSVELLLHKTGLVEALVSDAQSQLVSDGVKLGITAQAKAGAAERIDLAFVPARGRFEGRAKAGAELAPGNVDVALDVRGKAHAGKLAAAVVVPEPEFGGNVLVAGGYSAELFARPNGEVLAFVRDGASAEVRADTGASFKARASAKGGAHEEIDLAFDAPRACFAGKAKAGVELAPGPIELLVDAKAGAGAGIGRLERIALSVDASHGGQVVVAGDYSVELVAKGAAIEAFVFDASGKAHAAGDLDLKLAVGAGAGSTLALKWHAPSLSYKANAAANVDLEMQPLRLSLVASGKAFMGAVSSLKAAARASAKLDANAKLDAKLDANAKADANAKLAADAKAKVDPKVAANLKAGASKTAAASINVTPPKVNVSANQSATAGAKAGGGAKASAGFSIGTK